MSLTPEEYRCESCHGIFLKGQSDDVTNREAEQFGVKKALEHPYMVIVCDDCYRHIMRVAHN